VAAATRVAAATAAGGARGPCQPLAVVQRHTGAIQPSARRGRERRQVGTQSRHPGEGLRVTDGGCGGFTWHRPQLFGNAPSSRTGSANGLAKRAGRGNGWQDSRRRFPALSRDSPSQIHRAHASRGLLHAHPDFGHDQGESSSGFLASWLPESQSHRITE